MNKTETKRFDALYQRHLKLLKLQGKSPSTIGNYARAVRRITHHFDCCPDQLTQDQMEDYFSQFLETHSWSTVKVERNGLQFFWRHALKIDWQWINIIKPPTVKTIPDILSPAEVELLIGSTRKLRYRVFFLTVYSMGLRLSEALSLQVGDIDSKLKRIHVRNGKGRKDRFLPLPDLTLHALRTFWSRHRNPKLLFPNAKGSMENIQKAKKHMNKGGTQHAMRVAIAECGIKKKSVYTLCATVSPHTCLNAV